MNQSKNNKLGLAFAVFSIFGFISCASHQTGLDKSAGLDQSKDTTGPRLEPEAKVRGPVVLTLLNDTQKIESTLEKTKKYAYSAAAGKVPEERVEADMLAQGYVHTRPGTLPAIIREIKRGNPVVVSRVRDKKIDYDLVVGVELRDEKIIYRSGKKLLQTSYESFFESWRKAGHYAWAFIPREKIVPTMDLYDIFSQAVAMEKSHPAKARSIYRRLIELDDNRADFHMALANSIYRFDPIQALQHCEEAVNAEPNRFETWYNLAAMQSLTGQNWQARRTSRKIISMFRYNGVEKRRLNDLRSLAKY